MNALANKAQSWKGSLSDEPGLKEPALDPVLLAASLAGPSLASALGGTSAEIAPEMLPAIAKGSKVGGPHALFAYNDNFGPDMTKRAIYNVFGDPAHPAIQKAGWGSSVPIEMLRKFGIPVVGRQK